MKRTVNYYFAGKIEKHGWRESIVGTDRQGVSHLRYAVSDPETGWVFDPDAVIEEKWPVIALSETENYVGPFFVGCDHGCYHGPRQHGNGVDGRGCYSDGTVPHIRQFAIHELCLWTIAIRTDIVFAWIDSDDVFGTFAEIAYAAALNKEIWIATDKINPELWFIYHYAHNFEVATTPLSAWKDFHSEDHYQTYSELVEKRDLCSKEREEQEPPFDKGSIFDAIKDLDGKKLW